MFQRLAALLLVAVAIPVGAAEPENNEARLKTSLATWEKVRQACAGNYSYVVRWTSAFGFGHQTTVVVQGNKVVERKYEVIERKPTDEKATATTKWTEKGTDLGSHKTEGAPARTVDDLYAEAQKIVTKELPKDHQLALGFDKQGVLNYCFTRDTRIADDAPRHGIGPFQLQIAPKK